MNKLQIYMHGENNRDLKLVEISEEASVKDIIDKYRGEFPNSDSSQEIELFFEEEEFGQKPESNEMIKLRKRMHIHCHRCKAVSITVDYNGQTATESAPPSTTAKKILKIAAKKFNITDGDAADLLLKLSDGTVLNPTDHIGSFLSYPICNIRLLLTANKQVQG